MTTAHDPWEDWDADDDPFERAVVTLCSALTLCIGAGAIIGGLLAGAAPVFVFGLVWYPLGLWLLHRSALPW